MSQCIVIIGKKKTGKTTKVVEILRQFPQMGKYIFDVNNEYTAEFGVPNNYRGPLDMDAFLESCSRLKNSIIVCEEAAPYLGQKNSQLRKIMQLSRHTGNVVLIILHQVSDLPSDIYGRIDYVCLFKTQDFSASLDRKFRTNEQFMTEFQKVKNADDLHSHSFFSVI